MMSAMDPPLHERVYHGIKEDFLAGHFVPGRKIDLQLLATRHRSSKTPVREAAFMLSGEQLLTHHSDGGFVVPILEPAELIELLAWHMQMVLSLLANLKESTIRASLQQNQGRNDTPSPASVANLATNIFASLAAATGNRQSAGTVRHLNERLHYSRIADMTDPLAAEKELRAIANVDVSNLPKAMRRRIEAYHLRKIDRQRKAI